MTRRRNLWDDLDAAALERIYQGTTAMRQEARVDATPFAITAEKVSRDLADLLRGTVGEDAPAQLAAGRALLAAGATLGGLVEHQGSLHDAPAGACLALVLNALGWAGCDLMDGD